YSEHDADRRRALSDEALEVARRVGDDATLARVLNLRYAAIGDPENAAEQLANTTEALDVTDRLGDPLERFWALQSRLWAIGAAGFLDELVDAVARQVTDNPGIPGFGILLALCHCELDRYDDARAAFAPAAADGFASIPHDPVWSSAMTMGAEVAAVLEDADAAAVLA